MKLFHIFLISFCLALSVPGFCFLFTLEIQYGDYLIGCGGPVREWTKLSIVPDPLHVRTFTSFLPTSISFIVIAKTRIWRSAGRVLDTFITQEKRQKE